MTLTLLPPLPLPLPPTVSLADAVLSAFRSSYGVNYDDLGCVSECGRGVLLTVALMVKVTLLISLTVPPDVYVV